MSKEQKITTDIKVPNKDLEALRLNFPQCFDKDGNFQLEKFKTNLTEKEINFSTESYGLDWLGKSYARLLASDPATTLLKADETHNTKLENANSENLLIKGDNLEVLKHLANAYYEQVKMIYIDPPYNTGNECRLSCCPLEIWSVCLVNCQWFVFVLMCQFLVVCFVVALSSFRLAYNGRCFALGGFIVLGLNASYRLIVA